MAETPQTGARRLYDERKSEIIKVLVTPTCKKWANSHPVGYIPALLEALARGEHPEVK